jgi:hypothetical protein
VGQREEGERRERGGREEGARERVQCEERVDALFEWYHSR